MDYVKILGAPSADATTQTHELELADGGTLFLLITLHSPESSLTRIEAIRGAVNYLHHEVSKDSFEFEKFKSSVEKTLVYPQFEAVCAYLKDKTIYVFAVGETKVLLWRGKLVTLLSGTKTIQSASGYLKDGDALVLITNAFLSISPAEEIAPYILQKKLSALESDTATRVQGSEHRGECGLLCLFDSSQQIISPETAEQSGDDTPELSIEEMSDIQAEMESEEAKEDIDEPESLEEESIEAQEDTSLPAQNVFAKSDRVYDARRKSKRLAYVGVLLLVLLAVSIYFGNKARLKKQEVAHVSSVVAEAQSALDEAKSISSVNKSRARDLIVNAREQVLGVHTESTYPSLLSMKDALTQSLGDVAGVYETAPVIFSDLTLISQNTKADKLSISDNLIRILSTGDKKIITVELPGKRTETLGGLSAVNNPTDIATYTKRTFVMASDGVYDVSTSAQKQVDLPSNQNNLLFASFAGNIYMVDKSQNQIWRYSGDTVSFAEKKEWLAPDVTADFSKATAMGIDGSIWVYNSTGKLVKFTLGNPQTVPLKGLSQSLSEDTLFFTDSDSDSLYFLDKNAKAIFVFDKNGELMATYSNVSLSQAEHFVVSEANKLMIYSVGSKLYSISIEHIK